MITKTHLALALFVALSIATPSIISTASSSASNGQTQSPWPTPEEDAISAAQYSNRIEALDDLRSLRSNLLTEGHVVEQGTAAFHMQKVLAFSAPNNAYPGRSELMGDQQPFSANYYGFLDNYGDGSSEFLSLGWGRAFPNNLISNSSIAPDPENSGKYLVNASFDPGGIEALAALLNLSPGVDRMSSDGIDWADVSRSAGEYVTDFRVAVIMDNVAYRLISIRDLIAGNDPAVPTVAADNLSLLLAEQMVDRLGN